jgi:hypothetical protein
MNVAKKHQANLKIFNKSRAHLNLRCVLCSATGAAADG